MAWQLVYTSAPELLEVGRSGFGTVAKHEAIRSLLQTELERISQFNREQGLSKERIIFAHRVFDLRGERFHVLSRISDAGADYTGRTNHIAHHIILSASEAAQAGARRCTPADIIVWATSSGLWRERWNEPSRLLVSEEEIETDSVPARMGLPAVTWGSVTGNAANAAILAPGGAATEGCWLLYGGSKTAQLLPLIGESLCLISNPWSISFSTDTQPTDRIEEIQWRGVATGSPLERTARQSVRPVLDLGNPATLPAPVEYAANRAETGLEKAPSPASPRRGMTSSVEKVLPQDYGAAIQANPFLPKGKGDLRARTNVSLKDRMGLSGGAVVASKRRSVPVSAIVIAAGCVVLMLIGVLVWNACIFDVQEMGDIRNSTNRIINGLTASNGKLPDDAWWNDVTKGNGMSIGASYRIVPMGFKDDIRVAREQLSYWASLIGNPDLSKNLNDAKGLKYPVLLSKIIDKIASEIEAKKAADNEPIQVTNQETKKSVTIAKVASTPPPVKSTQMITMTLNGLSVTNGQVVSATNGQKFQLKGSAQSDAPVAITKSTGPGDVTGNSLTINGIGTITLKLGVAGNDQMNAVETNVQIIIIPPVSRITGIEFMDSKEDEWHHFFGPSNNLDELKGWTYWVTNGCATNLLQLVSSPLKDQGKIRCPYKDAFKQEFSNPNSCFFRKNNTTQEITLTIAVDANNPITNVLGFHPIVIQQTGEQYKCTLSDKVAPLIELFKAGKNTVEYKICMEPKMTGDSPESLSDSINTKIKSLSKEIALAEGNVKQEEDRRKQTALTNSETLKKETASDQKYPDMENAGEILSQGMTFKSSQAGKPDGFPEELKKYSAWRKTYKKDTNREAYTEYLKAVLAKIKDCENGLTFQTDTYISATKKIEDISINNKPETPTLGRTEKNDNAFMSNFKRLFTPDWGKNLEEFIASTAQPKAKPTPDINNLEQVLSDKKNKLKKYKESVQSSSQQILVRNDNGKDCLIFTTSP